MLENFDDIFELLGSLQSAKHPEDKISAANGIFSGDFGQLELSCNLFEHGGNFFKNVVVAAVFVGVGLFEGIAVSGAFGRSGANEIRRLWFEVIEDAEDLVLSGLTELVHFRADFGGHGGAVEEVLEEVSIGI